MTTSKKTRISLGPHIGPNARLATRERDGELTPVLVRKALDGEPLNGGELGQVENPDCMCGRWQDVTTVYEGRATEGGPAQVATPAYRDGYDRIFGKKPTVGLA
jgi:hypothetical protein